jgi:hypothetical protein
MNIIFGIESVAPFEERYIVLELDTFNLLPTNEVVTAYCLVESIPMEEMTMIENLKELHSSLMSEYRKRNWAYCEDTIAHLIKKWHGELDSFYTELDRRIQTLKKLDLGPDWTGRIDKTVEVA